LSRGVKRLKKEKETGKPPVTRSIWSKKKQVGGKMGAHG